MLQKISTHWIGTVTENFILDINNKCKYKWSQINYQKGTLLLQQRRRENDCNRPISLYFPERSLVKPVLSAILQIFRSWEKLVFFLILSALHLSLHRNTILIYWNPPTPLLFIKDGERKAKIVIWILTGSMA